MTQTMTPHNVVRLSAMDEMRFGVRTAKAMDLTAGQLADVMAFCASQRVAFLIARCRADDLAAAQAMEGAGFTLMDTLVYYLCHLRRVSLPDAPPPLPIRPVAPGEEHAVAAVALRCFHDYQGHYHADRNLSRGDCDDVYMDWARRSCVERDGASEVLIAEQDGVPVGFATLRLNTPGEGEGVLFAVDAAARKRGVYQSFMVDGMRWCLDKGATKMIVSTQLTNTGVQRVWTRLGFEPQQAFYTFHRWFDAG